MAFKRRLKFDKRIRFKKQMNIIYILLFIVLASTGIGYAYIKSNLNINGTANVTAARWDVHFTNLNVTTGSVTPTTAATITDPTTVTFAATLDEPNDFYEFTVDVTNQGTMDAMIDSFSISPTLTTAQKKYLDIAVTYSGDAPLLENQELKAGTTEKIKLRLAYKENSDPANYPTEDQTFNMSFSMNYEQADGSEIEVEHSVTKYTVNIYDRNNPAATQVAIGQPIPNTITQYNTPEEAMAAFSNSHVYLKHTLENGIVTESYVEFVVTPTMAQTYTGMTAGTYTLAGINTDAAFENNKQIVRAAFGSNNCQDSSGYTYCFLPNLAEIRADLWMSFIAVKDVANGERDCQIDNVENYADCGICRGG